MSDFDTVSRRRADHLSLRWLGPHKGMVHLALASITNAGFDLWEKSRKVSLWKLWLDLTPQEIVRLLDLSYLGEVLFEQEALNLVAGSMPCRPERETFLKRGYRGYDTSVGWIA